MYPQNGTTMKSVGRVLHVQHRHFFTSWALRVDMATLKVLWADGLGFRV